MATHEEYQLIRDKTGEVICTGKYWVCIGKFQSISPFSFSLHRMYSYDTYTIKETGKTIEV